MSSKFTRFVTVSSFLILATNAVHAGEPATGRVMHHHAIVHTSAEEAYAAFTTKEGIESWMVPHAEVDFRIGGTIKTNYNRDGHIGDPGTIVQHVLSFEPGRMFSMNFTAPQNAPVTKIAEATWTVLRFIPLARDVTRVTVSMMGYGTGPEWDAAYEHFDKGNAYTLKKLQERFPPPKSAVKRWTDGAVTVTAVYGPEKSQTYELIVPATPAQVWESLTTVEGIKRFYPSNPEIEMVPGGKWDLHGGKPNRVLSFIPGEMLAATGSAPAQFPNVMNGGMWGVFTFEPATSGATRLALATVGWQEGDEWDAAFEYFAKNNPLFLNMIHQHFANRGHQSAETSGDEEQDWRNAERQTRRLDTEVVVRASISQVWEALTTNDGLQTWAAPKANVELRLGGPYELLFEAHADPRLSNASVMAYLPERMLTHDFIDVVYPRNDGEPIKTWLVWRIDDVGKTKTRIRCTVVSEQPVLASELDYQTGKALGAYLGELHRRFAGGPRVWPPATVGSR